MRLRLPELLEEHGLTAYALSKASGGHISLSAAYRLVRQRGRVRYLDANVAEAICRVLRVTPGQLFEQDGFRGPRPKDERPSSKPVPRRRSSSK